MSQRFGNKPRESAADCVAPTGEEPSTPEHIKKYRQSYKQQAGVTILHHGVASDPQPNIVNFGKKTLDSDHANDIFTIPQNQGIKELVTEIQEQKYASRTREPLGARMVRNYVYPPGLDPEKDSFGNKTIGSEYTAKEVMFPPNPIVESEDVQKQYLQSHQSYEPGEQKRRNYQWPVDPKDMVFGQKLQAPTNEATLVLKPEGQVDSFPQTLIVKKKQEDFRNFQDDPLGQTKNLGQLNPYITDNTVFGQRPQNPGEWDAGKCLKGEANWKESLPDKDLGHTNRFGFRNVTQQGDQNRVFGVPTIRSDIKAPQQKSVADPLNYGDEPQSVQLLFPDQYSSMGLSTEDFLKPRQKGEIKSIFESIGHKFKIGQFQGIYLRAIEIEVSQNNRVSVQSFMQAVQELQDVE